MALRSVGIRRVPGDQTAAEVLTHHRNGAEDMKERSTGHPSAKRGSHAQQDECSTPNVPPLGTKPLSLNGWVDGIRWSAEEQ
jgi:hypothetical protein